MDNLIQVNTNDYNEKHFNVYLWSGAGYFMQGFDVYASDEISALDLVIAYCDNNNLHGFLIDCDDVEEDDDGNTSDNYIYIDATMSGATQPYYIYNQLRINEM